MDLFEQRWKRERIASKSDDVLEELYSACGLTLENTEKIQLRNRIMRMDPEGLYCEALLDKIQNLNDGETDFISEQFDQKKHPSNTSSFTLMPQENQKPKPLEKIYATTGSKKTWNLI